MNKCLFALYATILTRRPRAPSSYRPDIRADPWTGNQTASRTAALIFACAFGKGWIFAPFHVAVGEWSGVAIHFVDGTNRPGAGYYVRAILPAGIGGKGIFDRK